ncbi:MAG: hypothetical protein JWM87_1606 [Candidatus Eremiobacteraeota bacterium]|nr:hypothetical protein [Candidatus Eremiobacteraeota bacterium]
MAARVSIKDLKTRLARPATLIEVGGFRPPADPSASWFGRVNLALPGETWPMEAGQAMLPIAQLNLREAPFVPPSLADLELIAVFFGRGALQAATPNGDGWLVRAYPRLAQLTVTDVPGDVANGVSEMMADEKPIRPFPVRYTVLEHDYPDWEDAADLDIPDAISDRWEDHFGAARGCKLGGWPSLIQGEIFYAAHDSTPSEPEFVLQLDMVPKANFVFHADSTCYFARGTGEARGTWAFDWQCD